MGDAGRQIVRFFEEQLPAMIGQRARSFARTQGALTIIIEGVGSWTVTFGDARSPAAVVDEADTEADCIVVWAKEAFAALLGSGQLTTPAAEVGPIAVLGEIKLLASLGALLAAPAHGGRTSGRLAEVLTAV